MAERTRPFETPAFRALEGKIGELIRINVDNLAIGSSIIANDMNATAQAYCSAVAYIRALHTVIELCEQVEDEQFGRKRN